MRHHNDEEVRKVHLQDQAEAFGCQTETYPDNNSVFLRNVPGDLAGSANFERFVKECHQHNIEATRTWKEGG